MASVETANVEMFHHKGKERWAEAKGIELTKISATMQ